MLSLVNYLCTWLKYKDFVSNWSLFLVLANYSLNIFYFFLNRNGIWLKLNNIINALSLKSMQIIASPYLSVFDTQESRI